MQKADQLRFGEGRKNVIFGSKSVDRTSSEPTTKSRVISISRFDNPPIPGRKVSRKPREKSFEALSPRKSRAWNQQSHDYYQRPTQIPKALNGKAMTAGERDGEAELQDKRQLLIAAPNSAHHLVPPIHPNQPGLPRDQPGESRHKKAASPSEIERSTNERTMAPAVDSAPGLNNTITTSTTDALSVHKAGIALPTGEDKHSATSDAGTATDMPQPHDMQAFLHNPFNNLLASVEQSRKEFIREIIEFYAVGLQQQAELHEAEQNKSCAIFERFDAEECLLDVKDMLMDNFDEVKLAILRVTKAYQDKGMSRTLNAFANPIKGYPPAKSMDAFFKDKKVPRDNTSSPPPALINAELVGTSAILQLGHTCDHDASRLSDPFHVPNQVGNGERREEAALKPCPNDPNEEFSELQLDDQIEDLDLGSACSSPLVQVALDVSATTGFERTGSGTSREEYNEPVDNEGGAGYRGDICTEANTLSESGNSDSPTLVCPELGAFRVTTDFQGDSVQRNGDSQQDSAIDNMVVPALKAHVINQNICQAFAPPSFDDKESGDLSKPSPEMTRKQPPTPQQDLKISESDHEESIPYAANKQPREFGSIVVAEPSESIGASLDHPGLQMSEETNPRDDSVAHLFDGAVPSAKKKGKLSPEVLGMVFDPKIIINGDTKVAAELRDLGVHEYTAPVTSGPQPSGEDEKAFLCSLLDCTASIGSTTGRYGDGSISQITGGVKNLTLRGENNSSQVVGDIPDCSASSASLALHIVKPPLALPSDASSSLHTSPTKVASPKRVRANSKRKGCKFTGKHA